MNLHNIHIIGFRETKLNQTKKLKFQNYNIYRKDRNSHGGGVALIVQKDIGHHVIETPETKSLEAIGIKLSINNEYVVIITGYLPPNKLLLRSELNSLLNLGNKVIFMSDLNAKKSVTHELLKLITSSVKLIK